MKVRAIYCREDYNAFDEYSDAGYYGLDAEVPDDSDLKLIEIEAKKYSAIKTGYRFVKLIVTDNINIEY